MFTQATVEAIKSYVYVLTDEKDRIFYVGKGEGNRVFSHVEDVKVLLLRNPRDAESHQDSDDLEGIGDKRDLIAAILKRGNVPGMYVLREGLSPEQAFLIEAVLISVLDWQSDGELTNQVAGHGTAHFGLKSVEELEATKGEPFRIGSLPGVSEYDEVVAINVNKRWAEVVRGCKSLLEISRGVWKLNGNRAKRCPYAVIHANGVVRGVFQLQGWQGPDAQGRFTFNAKNDTPLVGDQFSNKNASSLFGISGSGSQNPIRYVKVPR